jgi:hypothetical protein
MSMDDLHLGINSAERFCDLGRGRAQLAHYDPFRAPTLCPKDVATEAFDDARDDGR